MGVDIQRNGHTGVPKAIRDDLWMNSLLEQVRGVPMPQIMKPDKRKATALQSSPKRL